MKGAIFVKKHAICLTIVSIIGWLLCSSVIWADDSDNNVSEEEVVVTASRTAQPEAKAPGKTEVITKEEIEASGATTVAEALEDAGVTVSGNGGKSGAATVRLDGSDEYQTLVLINGVPISSGPSGSVDLSYLPTAAIKRIEVSHGPLSALYGSSAIGGVINIITDLTGEPRNELNHRGGSFNTQSMDFLTQQQNWGLAIGGGISEGYLTHSKTYSNYLMGQYNFYQTNDEYLKLYIQDLSKHGQQPGYFNSSSTAVQSDQNVAMNLNGLRKFWGGIWEYKIYGQYYDLRYDDTEAYRHQVFSQGIDCGGQYQLGNHSVLSGLTTQYESFESTAFGDHSRNDIGLFLQDNWQLCSWLSLVTGLRQDYYSDFSSPLLPKVTLVGAITDQLTIKAGYGKTFRAPSFQDLYWYETGTYIYNGDTFNYTNIGNPDLKPEKGERYDIVVAWKQNHQSISLDMYQSNLQDGIDWISTPDGYTVMNIDKMLVRGIRFDWINQWLDLFTTTIGYNWLDKEGYNIISGKYDDDLNTFGKQQWKLGLGFQYKAWQYWVNWYLVKERCPNDNGAEMPDYDVLNLNVKYSVHQSLTFSLAMDNVTDETYQVNYGYLMPGRSYTLSTKYTF